MKKAFIAIAGLVLLAAPHFAFADIGGGTSGSTMGGGTSGSTLGGGPSSFELKNPLTFKTICGFLQAVFRAVLIVGIPIATLFIVWAGFLFVWARGNPEGLKKARDNAVYVLIGVAVFLGAWFLSQIIAATIAALGGPSISSCN